MNVESSAPRGAVFLSYASQDAEVVLRIAEALRAASVEVWFDQDELVGGDAWDAKIRGQIASCTLFVPVISVATQARREGYFRLEWKLADERTHLMADGTPFLLPIVIDDTKDREALVPKSFLGVQWTRLRQEVFGGQARWQSDDAALAKFGERVQRLLSGAAEATNGRGPEPTPSLAPAPRPRDENFWIAVLPFKCRNADAEVAALAEGLTEDVVTGLSRFTYLRVIANSSTARYAVDAVDIRTAGHELGARYVMEGSLRQSGSRLRVAVQLVDATSGAHLWAENYDRPYSRETVFDLQDDLVPQIVATVADSNGVLVHSMIEAVRSRDPLQLTPHETLLRAFGLSERYTPTEHAEVRGLLGRAIEQAPGHADCRAMLSSVYTTEFTDGFNALPDPLGRALAAAQQAVTSAPTSSLAHFALAKALFFNRELEAFRIAAERCISLNPLDAGSMAFMGLLVAYAGNWERGCELVQNAHELNPHHTGLYWFGDCYAAYRRGDYRVALDAALKLNMPGYYSVHVALAATYAQLGRSEPAAKSLQALLALRPDFAMIARDELGKWFDPELLEHIIDGLRKAGLDPEDPINR